MNKASKQAQRQNNCLASPVTPVKHLWSTSKKLIPCRPVSPKVIAISFDSNQSSSVGDTGGLQLRMAWNGAVPNCSAMRVVDLCSCVRFRKGKDRLVKYLKYQPSRLYCPQCLKCVMPPVSWVVEQLLKRERIKVGPVDLKIGCPMVSSYVLICPVKRASLGGHIDTATLLNMPARPLETRWPHRSNSLVWRQKKVLDTWPVHIELWQIVESANSPDCTLKCALGQQDQ